MKLLDFIIIGAQKAGTTSLYEYLKKHPDIYMPEDKELPFFTQEKLYQQGWESIAKQHFTQAPIIKKWGTASPQYMGDLRAISRIYQTMPEVKLIALLRNPIERAYSHYLMSYRRGLDTRTFAQVIEQATDIKAITLARTSPIPDYAQGYAQTDSTVNRFYLVWGEYYRILSAYLEYFPKQNLHVVFTEDLLQSPEVVVKEILDFLQVNNTILPDNVGKIYHKGGKSPLIAEKHRKKIMSITFIRTLWSLVPNKTQAHIRNFYERINVKKNQPKETITPEEKEKLVYFFNEEVKNLTTLINKQPPWTEFGVN